jgi:outer membrane murein-binding lipoprotein Lpp
MPSYSQLQSQANSAKSNSADYALRKLADTVEQLTKKVKALEADVQVLKSKVR